MIDKELRERYTKELRDLVKNLREDVYFDEPIRASNISNSIYYAGVNQHNIILQTELGEEFTLITDNKIGSTNLKRILQEVKKVL